MKNYVISSLLSIVAMVFVASCGHKHGSHETNHKTSVQTNNDTTDSSKKLAAVYQCPMKCEGDKTYDAPGKCPKCNMDLEDIASHEGHDH